MSYVSGTDYISVTDEVRALARSVINTSIDFTDAEIIRWQYMRYSQIRTITDKDDWASTDREFGSLQLVETKLAASDILEHYGTAQEVEQIRALREGALMDLTKIVDNMSTASTGGASGSILQTEYKGWILNSAVAAPNRLSPSLVGGVEGMSSMEIDL